MSLERIKAEIDRLAATISAPPHSLPTYGHTKDFAHPHIEFDGSQYHYVVVERGNEFERVRGDSDAVLYLVFRGITHGMASKAAASKDRFRERLFAHQLELLGRLDEDWRNRCAAEIDDILKRAPLINGA